MDRTKRQFQVSLFSFFLSFFFLLLTVIAFASSYFDRPEMADGRKQCLAMIRGGKMLQHEVLISVSSQSSPGIATGRDRERLSDTPYAYSPTERGAISGRLLGRGLRRATGVSRLCTAVNVIQLQSQSFCIESAE